MILGTKARYAVMAMAELASRVGDRPVKLAELADSQEMTVPYLEQIFGKLRSAELVRSVRGPGGGYVLNRAPQEVLIADIVAAVDESVKMTRCDMHDTAGCMSDNARCVTHDLWEGLEKHIQSYLRSITLADVQARKVVPDVVMGAVSPTRPD